jgi:hypothetical protein
VLARRGEFQTAPTEKISETECDFILAVRCWSLNESNLATIPVVKSLRDFETQKEIRERLERIEPSIPRQWGRMTAHQMICHLADSFRGVMGEKALSPAATPLPPKIMKFIALDLPMKWPHGLKTRPEIDQEAGGTPPAEFAADVATVKALLHRFVSDPRSIVPTHPFFGPMSEADWMRWGYLHLDHHLRQFGK